MTNKPIEGIDFYWENDFMVLTEKFLLNKGYCCGNGCKNCPYNYISVPEPKRTELLKLKEGKTKQTKVKTKA